MKKLINKPEDFVDDMLEGIYRAHGEIGPVGEDLRCLVTKRSAASPKVGLATGGGSGHLPTFLGFVGDGMLDGAAIGGVFQSPSADQMLSVTKQIDQGRGVVYIYGNYTGDIINFDMAGELAELDDIMVKSVVCNDDVASSIKGEEHKRRGVAGILLVCKAAGAAAAEGMSLDEVVRVAEKAKAQTRTIGVALTSCIVPEIGKPTFDIADDEMEIGMGIHGEPGIEREKLQSADVIVDRMMDKILSEDIYLSGDEVAVVVNGLGATPLEELYILHRRISQILDEQGIGVKFVWVGEFATSMEMSGASISLLKLDEELSRLMAAPADTPFFKCNQRPAVQK
jgi:dihydroxyacetone kinase-like protein